MHVFKSVMLCDRICGGTLQAPRVVGENGSRSNFLAAWHVYLPSPTTQTNGYPHHQEASKVPKQMIPWSKS
jgi:hypothetical protein